MRSSEIYHGLIYLVYHFVLVITFTNCVVSIGGLDKPIFRPYVERDWRFGHYEMEGLQDPLSRLAQYMLRPVVAGKKAIQHTESDELLDLI